MRKLRVGDVVRVKAIDGPDCLVSSVEDDNVSILWFDDCLSLQTATIDQALLEEHSAIKQRSIVVQAMIDKLPLPRNSLDEFYKQNWALVSKEGREACLAKLRKMTPPEMLEKWKEQLARGERIGSDSLEFHFGIGMQIRNTLRSVLVDDELPDVEYEDGSRHRNWDDFYMGALEELASE